MQPKFCRVCGNRLQVVQKVQSYDEYTGEPTTETTVRCASWACRKSGGTDTSRE